MTLLASLRPAVRATRVPPIAAVREGATLPESRFARFRTVGSLGLTALGFAALAYGLFGSGLGTTQILLWMGLGALLIFLGVALFSAKLVRPLAAAARRAAGALRRRGRPARARQRAPKPAANRLDRGGADDRPGARHARRDARGRDHEHVPGAVDEIFTSDYAITAQNNFSPIPTEAAEAAAEAPGVEAIASTRTGEARVFDETEFVTAVDEDAGEVITLDWVEGSQAVFRELGANGAFVDDGYAEDHDLGVGSPITIQVPSGKRARARGEGHLRSAGRRLALRQRHLLERDLRPRVRVAAQPLHVHPDGRRRHRREHRGARGLARTDFPNAKAQTRDEFVDNQIAALNQILNILYVLLALSVIVSLFGIVNTLVLTVFERTRELGMLRAIGMTRRQVRRMIRHESVITALIGGALGIVLGVVLGALLIARVEFIEFSLPDAQVVVFALATILVGILAAIFPARRAAKLDPLEALQYE